MCVWACALATYHHSHTACVCTCRHTPHTASHMWCVHMLACTTHHTHVCHMHTHMHMPHSTIYTLHVCTLTHHIALRCTCSMCTHTYVHATAPPLTHDMHAHTCTSYNTYHLHLRGGHVAQGLNSFLFLFSLTSPFPLPTEMPRLQQQPRL